MILKQHNENFASGEFIRPNAKGECVKFTFEKLEDYATTKQWYDSGYTKTMLKQWWSVQVYVYLPDGTCVGRYNPMEKPDPDRPGHVRSIDFDWVLEATKENQQKLIDEIKRRAFVVSAL